MVQEHNAFCTSSGISAEEGTVGMYTLTEMDIAHRTISAKTVQCTVGIHFTNSHPLSLPSNHIIESESPSIAIPLWPYPHPHSPSVLVPAPSSSYCSSALHALCVALSQCH